MRKSANAYAPGFFRTAHFHTCIIAHTIVFEHCCNMLCLLQHGGGNYCQYNDVTVTPCTGNTYNRLVTAATATAKYRTYTPDNHIK